MKNIPVPIFAIDFEGSKKLGVVEYGAVEIFRGEIVGLRTRICAPKCAISARDSEFFGISNAKAAAMPPFSGDVPDFCAARRRGIMASHNAAVEDSFLRAELPTPGIVPNFADGGETREWGPWLDTCALAKNIFPDIKSAKLSDLIEVFGILPELERRAAELCPEGRRKWHCAPYDALAAALLLVKICAQDGFENVNLAWLARYSGAKESGQKNLFQ